MMHRNGSYILNDVKGCAKKLDIQWSIMHFARHIRMHFWGGIEIFGGAKREAV